MSLRIWNCMRLWVFLVCSAVALCGTAFAQSGGGYLITTVAGTVAGDGQPGFSGDGGLATAAQLRGPTGVAVDAAGNLFVADTGNQRIRKVSASGIITTVAGNGTQGFSGDGGLATAGQLYYTHGVAVDATGSLYIADWFNGSTTGFGRCRRAGSSPLSRALALRGSAVTAVWLRPRGSVRLPEWQWMLSATCSSLTTATS
jgi:hypothetical protein